MTKKRKSHYSVSLGSKFLNRARLIFLFSFISVVVLLGLSIYNSVKSGAIQNNIIDPTKKVAKSFLENITAQDSTPFPTPFLDENTNTQTTVIITNEDDEITPTPIQPQTTIKVYYNTNPSTYTQSSYSSSKSFEEIVSENNKWFEEQKAANEKWFQEESAKNSAEYKAKYDSSVQKMDEEYNANVQKAKEEQEAWKKTHGF